MDNRGSTTPKGKGPRPLTVQSPVFKPGSVNPQASIVGVGASHSYAAPVSATSSFSYGVSPMKPGRYPQPQMSGVGSSQMANQTINAEHTVYNDWQAGYSAARSAGGGRYQQQATHQTATNYMEPEYDSQSGYWDASSYPTSGYANTQQQIHAAANQQYSTPLKQGDIQASYGYGHNTASMVQGSTTMASLSNTSQYYPTNTGDQYYNSSPGPQQPTSTQYPLQYHLYPPPLPHVTNLHPNQRSIQAFFMSDRLREELSRKSEAIYRIAENDGTVPQELQHYHSLYPLDEVKDKGSKLFGWATSVYKATSALDGRPYALRRIEGFRLTNEAAMSTIEQWRRIRHSNIVSLRESFTTKQFGDHSLVFVYDYHPLSVTLYTKLMMKAISPLAEKIIWSYAVQVCSALKCIHSAGLACRVLDPTKILITGKNRLRINCVGIFDLISYGSYENKSIAQYQQEDIHAFGRLILFLTTGSPTPYPKGMEILAKQYSSDVKNFVLYLLTPNQIRTVDDIIVTLAPRIMNEVNSAHHYNDLLEAELLRELENGRLVRLMAKINFITERPEFDRDPNWSETGDRYIIKLFRDYVFHQIDENGEPVLDIAHVVTCLNKLDAGIPEKILLISRDEQSCLVVTYKEVKNFIDTAFRELSRKSES